MAVELRHMRLMLMAADQGSLRRAAQALGLGQPTLSRAIQDLEDLVGGSLFERSHAGVRPTSAGQHLIDRIRPMLVELDEALRTACSFTRGHAGTVRIGMASSSPSGFLSKLAGEYALIRPDIALEFFDGERDQCRRKLANGQLDAVISYSLATWADVDRARLWSERLCVVDSLVGELSGKAAIDWRGILDHHLIFGRSVTGLEMFDILQRRMNVSVSGDPALYDVGFSHLLELVAAGAGITLLPTSLCRLDRGDIHLLPVTDEAAVVDFDVVWRSENDNPAMRHLLRFLQHRGQLSLAAEAIQDSQMQTD